MNTNPCTEMLDLTCPVCKGEGRVTGESYSHLIVKARCVKCGGHGKLISGHMVLQ